MHISSKSSVFLGFMVSKEGLKMEEEKVNVIVEWPHPRSITKVRSFHGLVTFYRKFIRNFSSLVVPIIECTKAREFSWIKVEHEIFELLKKKIATGPILVLPNFKNLFEVDYDACHLRIRALLS